MDRQSYAQDRVVREKQCPVCGQRFQCSVGDCWCNTLYLTEDARSRLPKSGDCLCPKCLASYAAAPAPPTSESL